MTKCVEEPPTSGDLLAEQGGAAVEDGSASEAHALEEQMGGCSHCLEFEAAGLGLRARVTFMFQSSCKASSP